MFEPHRGQRFFFFSVWAHFLPMAIAQKVLFGMIIGALKLITFKPLYICSIPYFFILNIFYRTIEILHNYSVKQCL